MQCGVGDQCAGAGTETGRADNARRLAGVPGMIVPAIAVLQRSSLLQADGLTFPLLLRPPGFHTGRHFRYVADQAELAGAATDMPGDELLAIEYLDARGVDGMARKYRVMFIDGVAYPLHLAISADWKVHYFTAAMATSAAYRAEERRFLDDMSAVLGARAMAALAGIGAALGLDYAGVDFALAPDGSVLLFEANATMVIVPPELGSDLGLPPPRRCRRFGGREANAVAARQSIGGQPFTCWISFAQRSSTGSVASAFAAGRLTLTRTAPRSR